MKLQSSERGPTEPFRRVACSLHAGTGRVCRGSSPPGTPTRAITPVPDLGAALGQLLGFPALFLSTGGHRRRVSQHPLRLLGLLFHICEEPAADDACLPPQHSLVLGPRKPQLHSCGPGRGCQGGPACGLRACSCLTSPRPLDNTSKGRDACGVCDLLRVSINVREECQ